MEAEFGCRFGGDGPPMPPEVEWDWLNYIQEFERQYRRNQQTTVKQFVGNPPIHPPESLDPSRVGPELERLLGLLAQHSVIIHWTRPLPPLEMYRFLVEELLMEEMDDIRIPGMTHNFIYDEFHPDEDPPPES